MDKVIKTFAVPSGMVAENVKARTVNGEIEVTFDVRHKIEPKKGDFLVNTSYDIDNMVFIYSGESMIDRDGKLKIGALIAENIHGYIINFQGEGPALGLRGWCEADKYRFATEEEKQAFLKRVEEKIGRRWNFDTMTSKPTRWRAVCGGRYYSVDPEGVTCSIDYHNITEDLLWESGNYFRTQEAAQEMFAKIKRMFLRSKAE